MSRFCQPKGGCRILIKHSVWKFIVTTVAIVYKPFKEQRMTKNVFFLIVVGEVLEAPKRLEDQTPSWIQSEEERPSFSAATPTFKHGYNTKVISEVLT